MNNDLEQFSEERLIELAEMCESKALGFPASHAESAALARIALAAKQDKPKFEEWMSTQSEKIEVDCGCVTTEAFYHWLKVAYEATPQPAHTEQDGWIKYQEQKPAANEYISFVSRHGEYASGLVGEDEWVEMHDGTSFELAEIYIWLLLPPMPAAPKPEM